MFHKQPHDAAFITPNTIQIYNPLSFAYKRMYVGVCSCEYVYSSHFFA